MLRSILGRMQELMFVGRTLMVRVPIGVLRIGICTGGRLGREGVTVGSRKTGVLACLVGKASPEMQFGSVIVRVYG